MSLDIRTETAADAEDVRRVVAQAFAEAEHRSPALEQDGVPGEATLVGWLRQSPAFAPEFSVVALAGTEIVGHAIATWGDVDGQPVLGVGPVSVVPTSQGRGIGAALMEELVARAERSGQSVLVLLGEPSYYSRFGFQPAAHVGITANPAWGDYFQARVLAERFGAVPRGQYTYAEPFQRLAQAV